MIEMKSTAVENVFNFTIVVFTFHQCYSLYFCYSNYHKKCNNTKKMHRLVHMSWKQDNWCGGCGVTCQCSKYAQSRESEKEHHYKYGQNLNNWLYKIKEKALKAILFNYFVLMSHSVPYLCTESNIKVMTNSTTHELELNEVGTPTVSNQKNGVL